jgi:TrmH family RNA methyltransferase
MLSQNQIRHIVSLKSRKFRDEYRQFIAEGNKLVADLIDSPFRVSGIYASAGWIVGNIKTLQDKKIPAFETTPREMERISALSTPSPVLAILEIPQMPTADCRLPTADLLLALDDIRDPGNMGTILRIADWFGIDQVVCSETCVELFNPKVVQATMGSIARVKVFYTGLEQFLEGAGDKVPVYGAFLEGESLYETELTRNGVILIGNESKGISHELEKRVTRKIFIPSYGDSPHGKAESLNASVAAAVICAEFRRKIGG